MPPAAKGHGPLEPHSGGTFFLLGNPPPPFERKHSFPHGLCVTRGRAALGFWLGGLRGKSERRGNIRFLKGVAARKSVEFPEHLIGATGAYACPKRKLTAKRINGS